MGCSAGRGPCWASKRISVKFKTPKSPPPRWEENGNRQQKEMWRGDKQAGTRGHTAPLGEGGARQRLELGGMGAQHPDSWAAGKRGRRGIEGCRCLQRRRGRISSQSLAVHPEELEKERTKPKATRRRGRQRSESKRMKQERPHGVDTPRAHREEQNRSRTDSTAVTPAGTVGTG